MYVLYRFTEYNVPRNALTFGRLYQKILTRASLPLFENFNRQNFLLKYRTIVPYRYGISTYAVKHDIVSIPNRYGTVQPEPRKEFGYGVPYCIGTVAAQDSKGNCQMKLLLKLRKIVKFIPFFVCLKTNSLKHKMDLRCQKL